MMDEAWDERACRDFPVDLFYSESEEDQAFALTLCAGCPFAEACLEEALDNEPPSKQGRTGLRFGIRGGHTPEQRNQLAKELYHGR